MAPDTHHPDVAAYAATLAPRQLELARRLATPVTADANAADLLDALREARLQLEYLDSKYRTETTLAVLARIDAAIQRAREPGR